jgi:hypothetical protein
MKSRLTKGESLMRLIATAALAAIACASAATAFAQPDHLNDVQFIAANRCLGLMSSKTFGTPDAPALAKYLESQSVGRVGFVYDEADQAKDDARRDANRTGAETSARLIAERDGVCHAFVADAVTAAAAHSAHSS